MLGSSSVWSRIANGSASFIRTPNGRILASAILASSSTVIVIFLSLNVRRRSARKRLRDEVNRDQQLRLVSPKRQSGYTGTEELTSFGLPVHEDVPEGEDIQVDDSLIREQLARNLAFLGEDGLSKVRAAFVVVVGLGGVGSAAAVMLCRSGVGHLRLIDFDQVSLSSLNRHATATLADVGTPKVNSARTFFKRIAPWVRVDARHDLFKVEDADELLSGEPDWVLDCIDNISTKVQLVKYCHLRGIKVLSVTGAASKADPSRIQIGDISMTFEDPLSRAMRRRLRLEGIVTGVPVVYSTEKASDQTRLLPLDEDEFRRGNVGELSALEAFRVRILPVLGPLPGIFGQAAAAHIITRLAHFPTEPLLVKNRWKTYKRMWQQLSAAEFRIAGDNTIGLSEEDVAYLFEEVHCGRSVVAPTFTYSATPRLLRWNHLFPLTWDNIACFTTSEATKHEELALKGGRDPAEVWGSRTADLMAKRQREERAIRGWRL